MTARLHAIGARALRKRLERACHWYNITEQFISVDHYTLSGSRDWSVPADAVLDRVRWDWCGGNDALTQQAACEAYLRSMPERIARQGSRILVLMTALLIPAAAVFNGFSWLGVVACVFAELTCAVAGVLFSGPPDDEVATVSPSEWTRTGLFSAKQRKLWHQRMWRQLPSAFFSEEELLAQLDADRCTRGVIETAMVLHRDGWPGTTTELLETAAALTH